LQEVFSDCKERILLKRKKSPTATPENPWKDVISKEKISEMSAMRLAKLYDRLQQLSYAQHEGTPLKFTAYVGNQTLMSRFRCISELDANTDDEEVIGYYNDEGWHNMCKSHYSLFLDGRTGLFFDEASDHHVALVHPLQFPEEHKKRELKFNLDDLENTSGEPGTAEYFSSFSSKCPGLTIVSIGEARLVIYYNGKVILESSNRTDFELKHVNANTEIVNWSLDNLKKLFEFRIFNNLRSNLEPYKMSSINSLASAICHVSDRPGCGGMIIFVNTPETSELSMTQSETAHILEGMRTNLNDKQISYWKKGHLYDHTSQSLINMMIPDGSMLINLSDFRIESQVYVVPIDKGKIVQGKPESGKGTRHRTALGISSVKYMNNDIWSVCISADGGISVYFEGAKKSPGDIRNTDKHTPPK
jgi:DNA integrity scanning protein DisA with diadenylate cyclase activity